MNFFSRRKPTIVLALIALVLLACVWYLSASLKARKNPNEQNTLAIAVREYVVDRDTDGDGLMDWEEDLWKTDKKSADTDGDGTNDNDEVRAGRNPTVPGPDDAFLRTAASAQAAEAGTPLTTTDILARNIFAEYYTLKQRGELDENTQEEIILKNLSGALPEGTSVSTYGIGDIRIEGDGTDAVRAYGNAVGNIIATHSIETENEAIIVQRALETDSGEGLAKLAPVVAAYRAITRDLLSTGVPVSATAAHLSLINATASVAEADAKLERVLVDPVTGLIGIREYSQAIQDLAAALKKVGTVLDVHRITFSPGESGENLEKIISQLI